MKRYLLCFAVALYTMNSYAQWTASGPSDFNQPSYNTVNSGNSTTGFVSSAIDGSGNLYVAYENDWNTNAGVSLRATVMKYNGSSWASLGPDTGFSAGTAAYTSMAINPTNGYPYVVYEDAANSNKATVMAWNGSNWAVVGSAGFSTAAATYTAIAFNSAGTPYVAFTDGTKVECWTFNGTSWNELGGAQVAASGRANSLAINPTNSQPYVFYSATAKATVYTYNGSSWVVVGTAGFSTSNVAVGTPTSIAFNSGTPYVAFIDGTSNPSPLEVWKYNGSSWSIVGAALASVPTTNNSVSLAINSSGTPYVVYELATSKAAVEMFNGSSWQSVGTATGISNGQTYFNSIAFNGSGTPYVFYADHSSLGEVTALQYNGSAWQKVGQGYGITGNPAEWPTIALDGSGTPYIAFYDVVLGSTVMKWNGSAWVNAGSPGFTGSAGTYSYFSIAISPTDGSPYVVYEDASNNSGATVQKYNGSSWVTVGSANLAGGTGGFVANTKIAFDASGNPYVAFVERTSSKATVAEYISGAWQLLGGDGAASQGSVTYMSLAINPITNLPYVAYEDGANSNLLTVEAYNGSSWQPVGTRGFAGGGSTTIQHPSLAFDASGNPYVAYGDGANSLKASVSEYNGSAWVNVGSAGFSAGEALYTSLAIYNGTPYVLYEDWANYARATLEKYNGSSWVDVGSPGFSAGIFGTTAGNNNVLLAISGSGTPYSVSLGGGQIAGTVGDPGGGVYVYQYLPPCSVPTITTTGTVTPVCASSSLQTTSLSYTATTNGQSQNTYTISGGTGSSAFLNTGSPVNFSANSSGGSDISITVPANTLAGTYTANLTITNGCGQTSSSTAISLTVNALPTPTFTAAPGSSTCSNTSVTYSTQSGEQSNSYVWTIPGTPNTDYTITSGGTSADFSVTLNWLTTGNKTVTVNYTNANGCMGATPASSTTTVSDCNPTWVGGNNANDWSTASNWSTNSVPNGCAYNVTIPSTGNDPVVNNAVSVGNITVSGPGRIVITLNNTLSVCGNWTVNSGASSAASGSEVILNGGAAQTLSGNLTFDQLAIANTNGGVSLAANATVGINTSLLLQTGNLTTNNGTLTLNSTSVTQAAIIDNFSANASPGNGTITGNITAERYYGPASALNDFNQHMLGSPVSGLTAAALGSTNGSSAQYEPKTGGAHNCDELAGQTGTPYGNVFGYIEANASQCVQSGWEVEASSTSLSPGTGYSVVLGSGSGALSLIGPPNLSLSYNVSTTNSGYANTTSDQGNVYPAGINLISNPYPAALTAASLVSDNAADFSHTVYVWNESTASYYTPAVIAPFQAFKVIRTTSNTTGNYVINGTARTAGSATFQRTTNPVELSLTVTNSSTGLTDETTVGFNPNATAGYDNAYDLIKLPGALTRHTLYTLNSNNWMWVNTLQSISETSTVPVGFEPGVSGTYTVNFSGLNSFDPTSYITLEDLQTGTMFDVRSGNYTFTSQATDNFNRFVLHFTPAATIKITDASCSNMGMINIGQPGTANWDYTIADANDTTVSSGTLNINSPVNASATAGVYTLTLVDANGYTVVKSLQVNGAQAIVANFSTVATVQVNDEVAFTSNSQNANSNVWNFGDGATANGNTTTHTYTTEGVYTVTLTSANDAGCSSSASHSINVTSRSITGIRNLGENGIKIWSNENRVNVSFGKASAGATVAIYNVIGQQLVNDKLTGTGTLYSKAINNIEAGYVIVTVKNDEQIVTSKVFISNIK